MAAVATTPARKRKPAGKRKAARRVAKKWMRGAADEAAVRNGCYFDVAAGARVCEFFETLLHHSKGRDWAGKLFALLDWERDILMRLFGWMRADGTRRFRKAYIEVAKKNGKSTLAAGIALFLLLGDGEPGAEVYCGATSRDQAKIVWSEAANMVAASPALNARTDTTPTRNNIAYPEAGSFLRAISAEAGTNEGLNIHGLVFDEMHALKDRPFWDALEYGGRARSQPLFVIITTSGWDRTSIGYELHTYGKGVLAGTTEDDSFFAYICAAEDEDDWTDPKVWAKANPSMGVIFSEADMAQACREAQERPAAQNIFRRYCLSQWTQAITAWLPQDHWKACGWGVEDPVLWRSETLAALKGQRCFGGLDLGSTGDLTALVLLFPREDEPDILLPWFWVPEEGAWRDDMQRRSKYEVWIRQGLVTATEGNMADYDVIRRHISGWAPLGDDFQGLADDYGIEELAVDRLFQGAQLCTQLMADGMNVIAFGQGFLSMAAPSKMFEECVIRHDFEHGNNPVLDWMAANVSVKTDPAGNIKPIKPEHGSGFKIDGIVAAVMAKGRAMATGEAVSAYSDHDLLVLG